MRRSALLAALLASPALSQTPAFPGAEGFGAYANGGRGGDVYTVTNLNADGPGSLREGIETAPSNGRTIVFAVSGYIHVPGSNLRIVQPNITIAGQTAPGDGIGLRDGTVRVTGDNTVIRHVRIRHGKQGGGGDCLNLDNSAEDSIIDHVSMQFSTDENISFFNSTLDRFTMQHSLSAWGLESHNAGGLWDLNRGSCHHSLWAHHHTRNPKARPWGLLEWVNNVTFDWGIGFIMGDSTTPAPWKANVIGSYFLAPPGRTDDIALEKARVDRHGNPNFSVHLDDNLHDADGDFLLDGTDKGYDIVEGSEFQPGDPEGAFRYVRADTPFPGSTGNAAITTHDPLTAFKIVLSDAGALRLDANHGGPLRDEVDTHLFDNLADQQASRISRESELPVSNDGFGTLESAPPPADADLDGMPDFWERAVGSDPANADHNTVFANDGSTVTADTFLPDGTPAGFTYLEEYLHFRAVPHAVVAKNTAAQPTSITVDLRRYTRGFRESPEFALAELDDGSVEQFAADGVTPSPTGPVVTFTPTEDFSGRAGFDFTVSDAEGSDWTRPFAVMVTVAALPRDLIWDDGGAWDTTSPNWRHGGEATSFEDGDNTLFDDRGDASSPITVDGLRSPGTVTITGSGDYHFTGGGSLSATSSFTKASETTLTLDVPVTSGDGTFLNGGTTVLNEPATLSGGPIRFTGGSELRVDHPSGSYFSLDPDLEVDAGATGNVILSQRAELDGSLSGGGTFHIHSPSVLGYEGRSYLDGASAGCTGTVNLTGGATAPGNGGRIAFRVVGGGFNGFPQARLDLSGIDLFTSNNSFGNTYEIGRLSGDANARFRGHYNAGGGVTTLSIGHLGGDSAFGGVIMDGVSNPTRVEKHGAGTLTFSGIHEYTGDTVVAEGGLRVTGALGNTAVTVEADAELGGSGAAGDTLTLQQDAVASPGNAPGEAGTLEVANGLELDPATLRFDLSSNPASGNDRILNQNGTLVLRSPGGNLGARFEFHLTDGRLSPGTYTLISGGSGTSAPGSPNLTHNLPANTRQDFSLQRSGGGSAETFVRLVVSDESADLTWTGSGGDWDLAGASPWSGDPDNRFFNLDRVRFTDAAASGSVAFSDTLRPQTVTVDNETLAYTFTGSGGLAGDASLVKEGGGTLVLANTGANTYEGGTIIRDGTLELGDPGVGLGSGPIELAGGTLQLPGSATFLDNDVLVTGDSAIASSYGGNSTIVDAYDSTFSSDGPATVDLSGVAGILSIRGPMDGFAGTLDFGGGSGMLRLNSGTDPDQDVNHGSADAHFALGSAGATLTNRNGDQTLELGALSGGSGTHLNGRQSGSGDTSTTYRIGALGTDTSFDGTISNAGDLGGLNLVKTGSGRLSLGGSSDYPGSIRIEAGTLAVPGSLSVTGSTVLDPGATLDLAGGTLASEAVQVPAGATLLGPGVLDAELTNDGLVSAAAGTLELNGPVVNNGTFRVTSGAILASGDTFSNNGVLDLLTAGDGIPSNLDNAGIVIDSGGLELRSFGIEGDDFTLRLATYAGHDYQLQWTPDLGNDTWTDVGSAVTGDGTEKSFTHPGGASGGPRFYRVVVTP